MVSEDLDCIRSQCAVQNDTFQCIEDFIVENSTEQLNYTTGWANGTYLDTGKETDWLSSILGVIMVAIGTVGNVDVLAVKIRRYVTILKVLFLEFSQLLRVWELHNVTANTLRLPSDEYAFSL